MWKRWSSNFPTSVTSEENKAKQQTSTAAEPALDQGPSRSLSTSLKDANTDGSILRTGSGPQAQAVKAEGPNIPEAPVPQTLADEMVKQSTGPLSHRETSYAELANTRVDHETTASPSGTPRADHGEHHSPPPLKPPPARIEEIPSDNSVYMADTPALGNTLLPPGSESPNLSTRARRLSFRSLAFFYGSDRRPPSTQKTQTHEHSNSSTPAQPKPTRAQRRALSSAMALRGLMIGPSSPSSPPETLVGIIKSKSHKPKSTIYPPLPNIKKVKAKLLKPESANAIISQLRRLPLPDGPSFHVNGRPSSESLVTHPDAGGAPIHAVCLPCTDEEAEKKYFSRLRTGHTLPSPSSPATDALPEYSSSAFPNISTASLESLIPVLRDLHLVSLLASPDLGFGQPVGGDEDSGILSGSVPSAATLVDGFEEITKQLMSLGFATSQAVAPSHAGIYPPTDRMSVLTYWWGLELVLPEPSIVHLSKAKSIPNTLLNFLSVLALFNNGVREALPFVRYIANFVNFEWSQIMAQDNGRGVVCAATWIMPAAMVPRPWDFASPPKSPPKSSNAPTSPARPETSPSKGTDGTVAPTQPSLEHSQPSDSLYPATPAMPLMPQVMVTPATLPRNFPVPQHAGA
ncbi:hypothetical protein JB92DRAFT_3003417 [Gautieria morchelliformis]|nr:hypothetical protein JB92DRAFT_3003417 [Gautieria morchelliformis]